MAVSQRQGDESQSDVAVGARKVQTTGREGGQLHEDAPCGQQ